ncbi:Hypp7202 [Branchiostoma lanceolatum]|uniref:Hypp7202 protein n=1 Tax=Branchiostoma lanceolatum TaxID=7740 RepID=A0A8K0E7H6_BRALA|nr:Hypp7202 [Branchiostoma lanceolatum]
MASPTKSAPATSQQHQSMGKCPYRSPTQSITPCIQNGARERKIACAVLNVKLTTAYSNREAAGKHLQRVDQRIIRDIVKNGPTKERLTKLAQAMGVFKACINAQNGTLRLVFVDLDVLDWFWAEHDHDAVATVLTDILVKEGVNESEREIMVRAAVDPAEFKTARRLLAGTETPSGALPDWPIQSHVNKCLNLEAVTRRALEDSELCERLIQMTQCGDRNAQMEEASSG